VTVTLLERTRGMGNNGHAEKPLNPGMGVSRLSTLNKPFTPIFTQLL